jgi:hypothetical protein
VLPFRRFGYDRSDPEDRQALKDFITDLAGTREIVFEEL